MTKAQEQKLEDFVIYTDIVTTELEEKAFKEAGIQLEYNTINGLERYFQYIQWVIENYTKADITQHVRVDLGIYYGELFTNIFGGYWTFLSKKGDPWEGIAIVEGFTNTKRAAQYVLNIIYRVLDEGNITALKNAVRSATEYSIKFKSASAEDKKRITELVKI